MNRDSDIQKILKSKYMKGPEYRMSSENIGINYFSGSEQSVFYELIGPTTVFRLIIVKPSNDLFTSTYVGRDYLLVFISEEQRMVGGSVFIKDDIKSQFEKLFTQLNDKHINELTKLWSDFVVKHYSEMHSID